MLSQADTRQLISDVALCPCCCSRTNDMISSCASCVMSEVWRLQKRAQHLAVIDGTNAWLHCRMLDALVMYGSP